MKNRANGNPAKNMDHHRVSTCDGKNRPNLWSRSSASGKLGKSLVGPMDSTSQKGVFFAHGEIQCRELGDPPGCVLVQFWTPGGCLMGVSFPKTRMWTNAEQLYVNYIKLCKYIGPYLMNIYCWDSTSRVSNIWKHLPRLKSKDSDG